MTTDPNRRRPLPDEEAANPGPDSASDTLADVRNAQLDPNHPCWGRLAAKVQRFLRTRFRAAGMPRACTLEDVEAEVLHRLVMALPHYEPRVGSSFWNWLEVLAQHTLLDLRRRQQSQRARSYDSAFGAEPSEVDRADPVGCASAAELERALQRCLASLEPKKRTVLAMYLLDGLEYDEIARDLGHQKASTIRTIVSRGRDRLAQYLRRLGFTSIPRRRDS